MSRVHDALRRAEYLGEQRPRADELPLPPSEEVPLHSARSRVPENAALDAAAEIATDGAQAVRPQFAPALETHREGRNGVDPKAFGYSTTGHGPLTLDIDWESLLERIPQIPLETAPEAHLINPERPHEIPAEEFRSLRTRLNHLQNQQHLHSVVVTSASPAEGKTFTAVNFALAQAQLAENPVLLADLDLRRPVIHNLFRAERSPGFSDFLLDGVPLESCIRKIGTTNLYFMPAGTPVKNPLELLNLRQVKALIEALPRIFNWIVIDTPPLLFSADANLLSTLTDGTVMVVRIGATSYDNVIRAMQSLCENNVLGIVANGARATELYSKYTYYYSKHD
ncbi:MAG: CpsD/CapB family tyrosine-protein kinase [Bryobacteraceae bacterium]